MGGRQRAGLAAVCAVAISASGCGVFKKYLPPLEKPASPVRVAIDLYYLGIDAEIEENLAAAEAAYRQSLQASPRPVVYFRLGRVLHSQGRLEEAQAAYQQAKNLVATYEDAQRALELVALDIAEQRRTGQARARDLRDLPGKPLPDRQLAGVSRRRPAIGEAEAAIGDLAEASPERPVGLPVPSPVPQPPEVLSASVAVAAGLLHDGKADQAAALLQRLLIEAPMDPMAHYYAGKVAAAQGDLVTAQAAFERTIALLPSHAGAHNNLGVIHEAMGRSRLAMESYQRAIDLAQLPEAVYNLAGLHEKRGEIELAIAGFRRYLELDSQSVYAERAKLHLERLKREW